MKFTAKQIADFLGGTIEGNTDVSVSSFSKIEEGKPGDLTFLYTDKYEQYLYETQATIVLVPNDFKPSQPVSATMIHLSDPREAVARLLNLYEQSMPKRKGISPQAFVSESAKIGNDCYIGPFAYVGDNVTIGNNSQIYPNTTIEAGAKIGDNVTVYPNVSIYHDCVIGSNVILHSGCVIGADGFGFAPTPNGYEKIPQIGIVTIEDDVEIGANTCVDRSTMGSTFIRKGVKLDNLVQIAHNDDIGENTVMSAQVGVAGSTKIGKWCMFGGQVGVNGHIEIGNQVRCGAKSGVAGDNRTRKGNITIMGSPAVDAKRYMRTMAVYKSLPDMFAQLNKLQQQVDELTKKLNEQK